MTDTVTFDGSGEGSGEGDGEGYGFCSGEGSGEGDVYGKGEGYGFCPGDGYGEGDGSGHGHGFGSSDGDGDGEGDGDGFGDGYGYGWWGISIDGDIVRIGCKSMSIDDWLGPRGMRLAKARRPPGAYVTTIRATLAHWNEQEDHGQ